MNAFWQHFASLISKAEADEIISHCNERYRPEQATVGHGSNRAVNENIRRCKVRWLKRDDPALRTLFQIIDTSALMANGNAFGFDLQGFHEVQMLEYTGAMKGHYDWHEDLCWKPDSDKRTPFQRKLSMVMQLSDPNTYEGGRLELDRDSLPQNLFRNPGDTVFFPSFLKHKANVVSTGVRYCLTAWWQGPNFR